MLIHLWDAAHTDTEWQQWLAAHDFGQLAVNGLPGEPPHAQPLTPCGTRWRQTPRCS